MNTLEVAIITYRRHQICIESIESLFKWHQSDQYKLEVKVLENQPSGNMLELYCKEQGIEYINSPANLGVAGGRNVLLKEAKSDWVVFMDDDVLFNKEFNFESLSGLDQDVAAVAFRVFNGPSNDYLKYENPTMSTKEQNVGYYIGAFHALRSLDFQKYAYPDLFYGFEEMDASYYIHFCLNKRVRFLPNFELTHLKSHLGRMPKEEELVMSLSNKLIVNYRYFPLPVRMLSNSLYLLRFWAQKFNFRVSLINRVYHTYRERRSSFDRMPINFYTFWKVKARTKTRVFI